MSSDEKMEYIDLSKPDEDPTKSDDTSTEAKKGKAKKKACKELQKKILAYMGQELQTDRKDMTKQEVAEGCGFSKAGSHRFHYSWQDLERNQKFVAKAAGKGLFCLTDLGKDNIPEGLVLGVSKKLDNAGKQESLLKILKKQCKEATDKVDLLFEIMADGQDHSLDEFIEATGYKNYKSKGLGYPLSHMVKKMKIVEKTASQMYRFADKCFPEGRPSSAVESP